jgi:hypothetical protein
MNQVTFRNKKEALKHELEIMEDLIPCLKGKQYFEAKRKYFELLHTYETFSGKTEPIYLKRSC